MHPNEHTDRPEALPAHLAPAGRASSLQDEHASAGRRPFLDETGRASGGKTGAGRPAGCWEGGADQRRGARISSSSVELNPGSEVDGCGREHRGVRRRPGSGMAMHLLTWVVLAAMFSIECEGFSMEELSVGGALCSSQVRSQLPLCPAWRSGIKAIATYPERWIGKPARGTRNARRLDDGKCDAT